MSGSQLSLDDAVLGDRAATDQPEARLPKRLCLSLVAGLSLGLWLAVGGALTVLIS